MKQHSLSKIYTVGKRVFSIDEKTDIINEITPICVHSKKIDGIQKCKIDINIVSCCGLCVNTCKNYKSPAVQLDLFY